MFNISHDCPNYGAPIRSLVAKRACDKELEDADPTGHFWLSSRWLLIVHCDLLLMRCGILRAKTEKVFESVLQKVADAEYCREVLESQLGEVITSLCQVCACDGVCMHLTEAFEVVAKQAEKTPQQLLAKWLERVYANVSCASSRALFLFVVDGLALHIDGRVENWGDFTWHKTAYAQAVATASGRQPNLEYHLKNFMVYSKLGKAAVPVLEASKLEGVTKTQAMRAMENELCAYQAQSAIAFRDPYACSLVWDGARQGNPGKEILVAVAEELERQETVVLPSQAVFE